MRLKAALLGAAMMLCAPVSAYAQAYIGNPGDASVSFGYTYAPSGKLIASSTADDDPFDDELPNVVVHAHIWELGGQWNTPLEGLAVDARIPLVGILVGDESFNHFPRPSRYDDGQMHLTFTDLRAGLRYQVKAIEEHVGLSFGLAGSVPVADYPTLGFGGPGHNLKAGYASVSIARTLDPIIPNLYIQLDYEFAKRERVDTSDRTDDFNRDYSDFTTSLMYFLPANIYAGLGMNYRTAHGGVTFDGLIFEPAAVQDEHDRLLKEKFLLLGGNIGYSVNEKLSLGAAVRFFTWGENTRNQNLFGISANYSL